MKIGIIGTRGIPNEYGGFEQFAEEFGARMAARGHDVTVYTSSRHSYQNETFNGVHLIHCYDPETHIGTAGQFVYDFLCIRDSRKRDFDVILQLGYTSSTVWSWLFPRDALVVTNMDGLEWKRSKYNSLVRRFLRVAEKWAVKYSDHLIADSPGIQDYLASKYGAESVLVAYGAELFNDGHDVSFLKGCGLDPGEYDLLVARFEPENHVATILEAYEGFPDRPIVLVGQYDATSYGRKLYERYGSNANAHFLGGVYDRQRLNTLRFHSRIYYHGHSVGGTNPSLIEAMACGALICANDNIFNRSVLMGHALYFQNAQDIRNILRAFRGKIEHYGWLEHNRRKVVVDYDWDSITEKLEGCFRQWRERTQISNQLISLVPERS